MTVTATDRARLRRARLAVHGLFLLSGIAIGTWTARIPAIKERLALGDGELSLGLLGIAAGAIVGMRLVGRLVDRHGSHRVMIPAAFAQGAVLVPPALAPDLLLALRGLTEIEVAGTVVRRVDDGDVVTVEIEKLGRLTNRMVAEA